MAPLQVDSHASPAHNIVPSLITPLKHLATNDQFGTTTADIGGVDGQQRVTTALQFLLPDFPVNIVQVAWAVKQLPILLSLGPTPYRKGSTAGSLVVDFDDLVEALVQLLNTTSMVSLCYGTGRESVAFVDDCYDYRNWLMEQLCLTETSISCSGHWLAMSILTHNLRRDLPEKVTILSALEEFVNNFMQVEHNSSGGS